MMAFGDNLKAARTAAGLTQQQIADRLGIDKSTYSGYETGKRQPDVTRIKDLSRLLGVSPDVLLETGFDATDANELELLKKYRSLDTYGKEAVDSVLDIEYRRIQAAKVVLIPDAGKVIRLPLYKTKKPDTTAR